MSRGQSLQDPFLNALRKERVPVSIYLVNGIKLQGQIDSRPVRGAAQEQRQSDGLQTCHFTVVPARAHSGDEDGAKATSRRTRFVHLR
jgi:hypothetical protein